MRPAASIRDLAEAVSDGKPIDWKVAEESFAEDEEKELVRSLRLIASVADVHRSFQEGTEEETAPAPKDEAAGQDVPQLWGHLEILERIGEGAYAEVYRARDTRLDREVALKLYRTTRSTRGTESILKEGRLLARIRHPNVVTVYGADEHDGRVGLWMELVHGQTLSQIVRLNGPMSSHEAAGIGMDVCRGVAAIHKAGLLHRDIKAQNVMREKGGRILLLDLGFGAEQAVEDSARASGRLAGTPYYMAPELFRLEPATVRADVYAIGVLLYFLTTGRFPALEGDQAAPVAFKSLRDARPELPDPFIQVVDKATSPGPKERFASVGEMAKALGKSVGVEGRGRRPLRYLLGSAAALLVLLLGTWWAARSPPLEPPEGLAHPIAVLPFENRSNDRAMDFLCAGVWHGIISRLSQLEALRVVSGTSVEKYREGAVGAARIGEELSVQSLLTGRIDLIDGQIVVYVELVDARRDRTLWGKRFVRRRGDVLELEEEFATQIAGALGLELSEVEAERLARRYTSQPEAYELYQMGRFSADKRTQPDLEKALGYFERAVEVDPDYAMAYAGIADTLLLLGTGYFVADEELDRDGILEQARAAAETALRIEEDLPDAHASLGLLYEIQRRWQMAGTHYRRAITLSPNLVRARQWYSHLLSLDGRHEEAISQAKKALELDPISALQHRSLGVAYYEARRYGEAIPHLRRTLDIDPVLPAAREVLALCYWHTGQRARAVAEYKGISPWKSGFFHLIDTGQSEEALQVLEQQTASVPQWLQPLYHMLAGDEETALSQLEGLAAQGVPNVEMPLRDKAFDHLLKDERFLHVLELSRIPSREGLGRLGPEAAHHEKDR